MKPNREKNYRLTVEFYENDGFPFQMCSVYTDDGKYIGDIDWAKKLIEEYKISFFDHLPDSEVCTIGFSEINQTWYGWSHRAIYGFYIGSEVKKGDIAYTAKSKADWINCQLTFFESDSYNEDNVDGNDGIWVHMCGNRIFCIYPSEFGRGEWKAETLEDARQMAIDFARGAN